MTIAPRFPSILVPTPSGAEHTVVSVPATVAVLLYDDVMNQFVLVRQFRAGMGKETLNAVAGYVDEGETPEEAARRECQEEVGLNPKTLWYYGEKFKSPGWNTETVHLFIGLELEESRLEGDETEKMDVVRIDREVGAGPLTSEDLVTNMLFSYFE